MYLPSFQAGREQDILKLVKGSRLVETTNFGRENTTGSQPDLYLKTMESP
jgi:hypothetical protein